MVYFSINEIVELIANQFMLSLRLKHLTVTMRDW